MMKYAITTKKVGKSHRAHCSVVRVDNDRAFEDYVMTNRMGGYDTREVTREEAEAVIATGKVGCRSLNPARKWEQRFLVRKWLVKFDVMA